MSGWRILWKDSSGEGRYSDVESKSKEAAVWEVASMQSECAEFVEVRAIDT